MKPVPLSILILTGILTGAVADDSATGKVATAAARVAEIAKRATVCVEISLSAVENAMATQDQAESDLMKALKSGAKGRIAATEKKMDAAQDNAEEARELAKKIISYAADCAAAAAAAGQEAKAITAETPSRDVASALKRLGHMVDIAQKALKKAEALAETLKKQWLLPLASTTTTTTQPPSPTPVGRR